MGSGVLFGLYLLFRFFSKEYINYLLTAYFALLGWMAVAKALDSVLKQAPFSALRALEWNEKFKLRLTKHKMRELVFKFSFDFFTIGSAVVALFFTVYYVITKNWIASNVFGEAFAASAIQLLDLDDFKTGMILLSGLFVYDIFWVFGTEVMVSVAKNFDAPVKLLFPKDIFAEKLEFAMLGLGDIVIPGVFVALCLRFDYYLHKKRLATATKSGRGRKSSTDVSVQQGFSKPYFWMGMIFYVLGLVMTVVVMHTFKAAQPALLYLSPACILSVLLTATFRGELSEVFSYKSEASVKRNEVEKKTN